MFDLPAGIAKIAISGCLRMGSEQTRHKSGHLVVDANAQAVQYRPCTMFFRGHQDAAQVGHHSPVVLILPKSFQHGAHTSTSPVACSFFALLFLNVFKMFHPLTKALT